MPPPMNQLDRDTIALLSVTDIEPTHLDNPKHRNLISIFFLIRCWNQYRPRMASTLAYFTVKSTFTTLWPKGKKTQMSKRKGEFVSLDELIDDIGVDAARFFLLQRSHETPMDLDLALAREQSSDNPVYYVQYAHARIAGILEKAGRPDISDTVIIVAFCLLLMAATLMRVMALSG